MRTPLRPSLLGSLLAIALLTTASGPAAAKRRPPMPGLSDAIVARLPPAGWLVAHATDRGQNDWFAITRVGATGAVELTHEATVPDAATWLDGHALVTMTTDVDSDITTVRRYVDGRADEQATVIVPATAWALPKGKTLVDTRAPELWLGKAGAVWLARCHTTRPRGNDEVCAGRAWVRVDGGLTAATRAPAKVRLAAPAVPSLRQGGALPKGIKAPAGFAVTLRKITVDDPDQHATVKGFACAGPGAAPVLWPSAAVTDWQFDVRPTKVRWLATTPPLFAVSGKATNPVDEVTSEDRVFRGCAAKALEDFVWLGGGRWAAMTMNWNGDQYAGATWTIYVDDVTIATIDAAPSWFQVAPPP